MKKDLSKNNKPNIFKEHFRWQLILLVVSLFLFSLLSKLTLNDANLIIAIFAGVIILKKAKSKRIVMNNCDKLVLILGRMDYVFTFGKLYLKNKS